MFCLLFFYYQPFIRIHWKLFCTAVECCQQRRVEKSNRKMFLFKPSNEGKNNYDPAKSKYDMVNDACWKANENVPFIALAKTFAAIEDVSGRLKSIEIMSNYVSSVMALSNNDLVKSIYLCLNKVAPDYEGIELGKKNIIITQKKIIFSTPIYIRYWNININESIIRSYWP